MPRYPFAGSGTTGIACVHEGLGFVGIEKEEQWAEVARARIAHAESLDIIEMMERVGTDG